MLFACGESITAPGSCPDFCPTAEIQLIDSVLTGVIVRDTTFAGYVQPHHATSMQVVGGPTQATRAMVAFLAFNDSTFLDSLNIVPVLALDSFRLEVFLTNRSPDVTGLEITVHRLPTDIDTLAIYDDVTPFFEDSTVIGVFSVPDSVTNDTISAILPADAFPTLAEDGNRTALGLSIRGASPAFATMSTVQAGLGPVLWRFVQADSAGVAVPRMDFRRTSLDTFVYAGPPTVADPDALTVGGSPAARAFLRVNVPSFIIDSSRVVKAELLLVPFEPVLGAPSDTMQLAVDGVSADFGPKSPLLLTVDSLRVTEPVGVGSTDTIVVDMTQLMATWQADTSIVRTLVLRLDDEGGTIGELRLGSSKTPGLYPAMRLTYVPPFSFVPR
jgi:hypothetical protein